jgi:glycosyltransferase involved in cell wall biosynthesis
MRIACVHQGYELYGSDRCFAETVRAIRAAQPAGEITVVLPRHGPIVGLLEGVASEIVFEPLWVLRRRGFARLMTLGLLRLPGALVRAARRFATHDLVYINTTVVADHLLVSRLYPGRAILHAHEIPEGLVRSVLRTLLRFSRAEIVFNSRATRAAFSLPPGQRAHVIYNGIAGPGAAKPATYDGSRPLRLLMLGRISRIKGQDVLLDAIEALPEPARSRLELRIVGSAFEDEARERALAERIAGPSFGGRVTWMPFDPDPAHHYRWADIVVVPSRLPESLGRVAIEAMAYGRPALVSAIGGLVEVIEDGRTGWTVPPDRPEALTDALTRILADPAAWSGFGAAGRTRYEAVFSEAAAAEAIAALVAPRAGTLPDDAAGPAASGLVCP